MKRLIIMAMTAAAMSLQAAESGISGDAPRLAAGAGIGLMSMEGIPRSFGVGAFEAKITLRNQMEAPLRGRFAVKVAESDEEAPSFRVLAAATIDLTLASVNPEAVSLVAKGEVPADCLWRDVLVTIDARDREIVLFRGFVAGKGERPPRVRRVAVRRVVPGETTTRSDPLVFGEDFFPKGFRVAFVTPDGARGMHVKSAQRANWKVEAVHRGDAKGWAKLADELDKLDIVVSLAGFPSGVESNTFVRFVERGGTLWVNGADEDAEIAGLAAFAPAGHEPRLVVREFGDEEIDNHIVRFGDMRNWSRDSWEIEHPAWGNLVDRVPNTVLELTREARQSWEPIGVAFPVKRGVDEIVLARRRLGRGSVYLSTTPSADEQFYANLRFHAGLRTRDLIYRSFSFDPNPAVYPEDTRLRKPSTFSVCYMNPSDEPRDFRVTVKAEAEDGSRTVWKNFPARSSKTPPAGNVMTVPMDCFDLHGATRFTVTFEDLTGGYVSTWDAGVFERPPYVDIKPPFYRGWVSEKRAKAAVTIGAVVYDDAGAGKTVTLETYDTKGALLARQEGVVRQHARPDDKSVWFEVPVPADAPAGLYRLVALVDRDGEQVERVESFEIKAVEPKQVMYDQDGMLMREGRRFYGLGTYHLGQLDDPIGPWEYDTNRNEQVLSPEVLKEDGTPFTLWDVGITYTQCWEYDWAANFVSNIERLKKLDPINLVWALDGRGAMYKPLVGVNHRVLREQCRVRIEGDPTFYERLAEKNRMRAKKASDAGMLFCIEMGLPMYYQMLYPARFKKPWEKELRCVRDDYAEVREIVRNVLRDDEFGTVGGWYVLDEGGGGKLIDDQDVVVREEDTLHPLMLLGDVNSLHKVVDIGISQVHPDSGRVRNARLINGLFRWGQKNRGRVSPHGGSIICCHRAADETQALNQSFDTLFTLELTAIMTGLNGSLWYTWKEDQRVKDPYGAGWGITRPRDLQKVCSRVKELEPYILNGLGTAAKSGDGKVRARLCGNAASGQALLLVNFERVEKSSVRLRIPELAGKSLEPMFEDGAPRVAVDAQGNFTVDFEPDVSRVLLVK